MVCGISEFNVMWKDDLVAEVSLDENNNVSVIKHVMVVHKQPFYGGPINLERVCKFLESRCYCRNYADIDTVLKVYGLSEYNPWEMVKQNHGHMPDDFIWIKFPNENLTWSDVNVTRR